MIARTFRRRSLVANRLACAPVRVHGSITHRFIDDDVAIADLDIVETVRVGADPRLELDRGPLAAKIRQRHQITRAALAASRKSILHAQRPFLKLHTIPSRPLRAGVSRHRKKAVCRASTTRPLLCATLGRTSRAAFTISHAAERMGSLCQLSNCHARKFRATFTPHREIHLRPRRLPYKAPERCPQTQMEDRNDAIWGRFPHRSVRSATSTVLTPGGSYTIFPHMIHRLYFRPTWDILVEAG